MSSEAQKRRKAREKKNQQQAHRVVLGIIGALILAAAVITLALLRNY